MRRRPTAIASALVTLAVVALFTACGGGHRYDARLVAADSLMWEAPDSALAVLDAIDSLGGGANQAYRDLLVTQARYKCYQDITALDDSAVTRAMDYYRDHSGEREKLTRATLYKGAVMEELGHVDSAMYYYKTAEVNADEKDYTNLGQINTRIAALFRDYYADPQICYEKNNQALKFYILTGNKPLQLSSLINMSGCSGIIHKDDTEHLLNQASQIAIELNDSSSCYQIQELLCRQLSVEGKSVPKAKQVALNCLNDYRNYVNHDLLLDLAEIYGYLGMPDSSRFYLDMVKEHNGIINSGQVKTRKYLVLSDISRLEGDTSRCTYYDMLSHQASDSISNNKIKYQIQEIENSFNMNQHNSLLSKNSYLHWIIFGLIGIAVFVVSLLFIEYQRRLRNTKAIIQELEKTNLNHIHDLYEQFDEHNTAIEHLISNLVCILKTCVSDTNRQISTTQLARQIKESIVDAANDGFWNELKSHLDNKHNNMISTIAENRAISNRDLKFIELSCFGFSYLEIAMILNYSPRYVLNKRKIIAQKLGIQKPLQNYLNELLAKKGEK